MIEGSGSASRSIPLTIGSGSMRPKNMWIRWILIRIRIRNTGLLLGTKGGGATLAYGWGGRGSQLGRLERKPGSLSTLWAHSSHSNVCAIIYFIFVHNFMNIWFGNCAGTMDETATRKQKLETRRQILHATGGHSGTIWIRLAAICLQSRQFFASTLQEQLSELKKGRHHLKI
jgi:hypothetical protein